MMIRRLNTSSTARIFVGNVITVSQLRWEGKIQVIKWIPECLWCDLFFPLIQHSFMLLISSSLLCHFSVYAMSRHNRSGIIVCSLPYGVLIATYSFPCTSVKAIEIVENTCEQLRRWHIMLKCAFGLQRVQARNNGRTWIWDSETCFWDQFYSFNLSLSSLLSLSTMLYLLLSSALSLSDYVHVL